MIREPTWRRLAERYDTRQLMDLIFTVGQYNLVSMALNTLGVPLDAELRGAPGPGNRPRKAPAGMAERVG
jgi:hypothetical protein